MLIPAEAMPLFHKVRNDHPQAHDFAYYLEYLTFHMPEHLLVPGLLWLLKNRLTGQKFLDFVQGECKRSGLELIRQLTMRLEGEKKLRRLHGKDLRA